MVKKPVFRTNPERKIQGQVTRFLRERGWLVERMVGNVYQFGIPDLMCFHPEYGLRFIDIKAPGQGRLTPRQCQKWPFFESYGLGVWIMEAATEEEYAKLFGPPNFRDYWTAACEQYVIPVEKILQEYENEF